MPPQTRAAKRARILEIRGQALGIVLSSQFLHWYEAVKVGETCKNLQHEWQERKKLICEPLLASLQRLKKVSTNFACRWCGGGVNAAFLVAAPSGQSHCQCSSSQDWTPLAHIDPRFSDVYPQHGRNVKL
jgi:hypothetical protein